MLSAILATSVHAETNVELEAKLKDVKNFCLQRPLSEYEWESYDKCKGLSLAKANDCTDEVNHFNLVIRPKWNQLVRQCEKETPHLRFSAKPATERASPSDKATPPPNNCTFLNTNECVSDCVSKGVGDAVICRAQCSLVNTDGKHCYDNPNTNDSSQGKSALEKAREAAKKKTVDDEKSKTRPSSPENPNNSGPPQGKTTFEPKPMNKKLQEAAAAAKKKVEGAEEINKRNFNEVKEQYQRVREEEKAREKERKAREDALREREFAEARKWHCYGSYQNVGQGFRQCKSACDQQIISGTLGSLRPRTMRRRAKPQRLRPPTEPKEITMTKLILAVALTFALVAGAVTVTVTTLQPQPAMADPNGCNGC
jgi:hypothetical protein